MDEDYDTFAKWHENESAERKAEICYQGAEGESLESEG